MNENGIKENDILQIDLFEFIGGGCWDNIKNETDLSIGFDVDLAERKELYINLIHFDSNMRNNENYEYYNNFKVDVVGDFFAIDDIGIFIKYLEQLKELHSPFIVISSGSSAKEIIPICKNYSFIKEVIIFCFNDSAHRHYLDEYPGYVKKIFTDIDSVYDYLESIKEYKSDIELDQERKNAGIIKEHFSQCPVISATEYDKCYFLVHRAYAHFFGDIDNKSERPKFQNENFSKVISSLYRQHEENLAEQFKRLLNLYDNNTFIEKSIREYTEESKFCYLFNKMKRKFESGIISYAYYMGPLLYGLNKYVKENPSFAISNNMKLYRVITCSKLDFYLYQINVGHIICFPSLTSTSSKDGSFNPTNFFSEDEDDKIKVKLIFNYKHSGGNKSPGIIIENKKGHDGEYISSCPGENEVILFPFTFVRINQIKSNYSFQEIDLEIINRTSYIEYTLKNDVKNRILFNELD